MQSFVQQYGPHGASGASCCALTAPRSSSKVTPRSSPPAAALVAVPPRSAEPLAGAASVGVSLRSEPTQAPVAHSDMVRAMSALPPEEEPDRLSLDEIGSPGGAQGPQSHSTTI